MMRAADHRRAAREALKGFWMISLAVTLVATLLGGSTISSPFQITFDMNDTEHILSSDGSFNLMPLLSYLNIDVSTAAGLSVFLSSILAPLAIFAIAQVIIGGAVELGHNMYYIKRLRHEGAGMSDLFSRMSIFARALGLRLFMVLFIFLWSLLLVIPGIIASYRYILAPYLMAENPNMGIREAVNESKRLMEGNKWRAFCLGFSFIGWSFLAMLTLGIGLLWLNPYISAAKASFYLEITGRSANNGGGFNPYASNEPEFEFSGSNGPERI